ncbi:hypothetical protein PhaeoP18_01526 [Phaeobacter piscinae]|uniref:SAM-dependent methyltransferase n=1 Tax=Phaeobacter piscinae TaxID=1580596 RepID=UPI000C9CC857|nr:SAM-dependent methyltransferase [Phaeobacter piscinae]AUR35800.1 hypothetical protein PhaeoP18_01526 [Phaeobacter piscinae]
MGKRSTFKRRKNDLYRTPWDPVPLLAPHLPTRFRYAEPCAGNGRLIDHLRWIGGTCTEAVDINPGRGDVTQGNALHWTPTAKPRRPLDYIITNPPWSREILHPLILRLSGLCPTWLLFDADWCHTLQAQPYLRHCRKIVSVGRVKWIEGSKHTGKDNCAWHLFTAGSHGRTEFVGRSAATKKNNAQRWAENTCEVTS